MIQGMKTERSTGAHGGRGYARPAWGEEIDDEAISVSSAALCQKIIWW